jgi:serine/threonine-protein kinase
LEREAQFVAAIQHPNICDVLDVGTLPDGRPFIVLERLFGESLATHLRRTPRLHVSWAKELFIQILSGLHAAHGAGIVHRDLKPQNVFLVDRLGCAPLAKVVDFGFAKDLSRMRAATMTKPGRVVGTPTYMAPEHLLGERVDRRTDIFAVGVMLHEALAGRHPFVRATNADMVAAIMREEPPPLRRERPDLTLALEVAVRRALEKDREARWPTAFDMQRALVASTP